MIATIIEDFDDEPDLWIKGVAAVAGAVDAGVGVWPFCIAKPWLAIRKVSMSAVYFIGCPFQRLVGKRS